MLCNCSGSSFVVYNQLLAIKRSRSSVEYGQMVFIGIQLFNGNSLSRDNHGRKGSQTNRYP